MKAQDGGFSSRLRFIGCLPFFLHPLFLPCPLEHTLNPQWFLSISSTFHRVIVTLPRDYLVGVFSSLKLNPCERLSFLLYDSIG